MPLVKLSRDFYLRPTLRIARGLVGKFMIRRWRGSLLVGRIVEAEAYLGDKDPASHAFGGMTKRNEVMFRLGGHLYVYFTYGMHFCCNVVTEAEGIGHAVLIRALEPVEGLPAMARNRNLTIPRKLPLASPPPAAVIQLCNGPGKLCQALGIGRNENGTDLCSDTIWLAEDPEAPGRQPIGVSTRVGITSGTELQWRFFLRNSPYVSKGRPVTPPPPAIPSPPTEQ